MAKKTKVTPEFDERRIKAESDLEYFINLVHPKRYLGSVHRQIIRWWMSEGKSHQLLLLPRDHMKSALIAYRVAWELTKDPSLRILYISATSNLAIKQLKFIKDILTNDTYRAYWPDMINPEEAKREKWAEKEISIDHPKRREENIREPSVFTAGLTTNIIGLHADICVMDDVVVSKNAYTELGREKVREQYGHLSSIEGTGAREWVVGTRYHPNDLYNDLMAMTVERYDDDGVLIKTEPLFDVNDNETIKQAVESHGDGTGEYLWPRSQRSDGKWFGFDINELATKRTQYKGNMIQYRAQYYNDPQDVDNAPIKRDQFQYYDPSYLYKKDYHWHFQRNRLNVVAAVDFAFSTAKGADSTSIVVVGADQFNNYYVLDIDRFKTDKTSDYFTHILKLYEKWGFRKIRCEVSVAQAVIVKDLKDNYIRRYGLGLSIDEYRPTRNEGNKSERIMHILEPKYANGQMWHYAGGYTQILEEELIFQNPAHDDVKDALASAVDLVTAPVNYFTIKKEVSNGLQWHGRFGGTL